MSENLWHASWLNNLKLRFKAALAIGGLAALFGITAIAFLSNQREMVDARKWNEHTDRVMDRAHELQVMVLRQQMDVRSFLLTRESTYLNAYDSDAAQVDEKLARLVELTADNPEQQARLFQLRQTIGQWRASFGFASRSGAGPQIPLPAEATPELVATANGQMERILATIDEFLAREINLLKLRGARLDSSLQRVKLLTIAMLVAGFFMVALLLRGISLTLAAPMTAITGLIDRLTAGDLRQQIPVAPRRDEIGSIMRALESFRQTAREVQHREWIKSHTSAIGALLSRQNEFAGFASALLNYLAPILGAGQAALFRSSPESEELLLIGGYGLGNSNSDFRARSAGLVQQCARSGGTIELMPVPDDYVRVGSGTGGATAVAVYLYPLKATSGISGVIEFATFKALGTDERELLGAVTPGIGLALEALSNALRTTELLEETRIQQEELRTSEESLRVQQEELRTTNE
jgi:CHASE3 domain sensor protein